MDKDNQQETIRDTELAWMAGVIDADGNIQVSLPKIKKGNIGRVVNFWIDITCSDPGIIDRCVEIFEKMGIAHYDGQKEIKPVYKKDGSYYLSDTKYCLFTRVTRLGVLKDFLPRIIPHLAGNKKHLAMLMHRFLVKRLPKGRKPYDGEDIMGIIAFIKQADGRFATRNIEYLEGLLRDRTPNA
jgi:hypothetical protein